MIGNRRSDTIDALDDNELNFRESGIEYGFSKFIPDTEPNKPESEEPTQGISMYKKIVKDHLIFYILHSAYDKLKQNQNPDVMHNNLFLTEQAEIVINTDTNKLTKCRMSLTKLVETALGIKSDSSKLIYWLSWHQPTDDYRPLKCPPNENILGWWCSGSLVDIPDGLSTSIKDAISNHIRVSILVALVHGGSEENAKQVILQDWPEATEWRFCEIRKNYEVRDRFPLSDWMIDRIDACL